jgi:hypothetical protein
MPLYDEYFDQIRSEIADIDQFRRPRRRRVHRGDLPQGVRRHAAVGAHGHRRHRLGRRAEAVPAERADRVAVRTLAELPFTYELVAAERIGCRSSRTIERVQQTDPIIVRVVEQPSTRRRSPT